MSKLALHPVPCSDIVDDSEIVKSQSKHHYNFPEYSSSDPLFVTQEAPEAELDICSSFEYVFLP